jgi:hypothetical protein
MKPRRRVMAARCGHLIDKIVENSLRPGKPFHQSIRLLAVALLTISSRFAASGHTEVHVLPTLVRSEAGFVRPSLKEPTSPRDLRQSDIEP